jgi:hypothetical protein
LVLGWSQQDFWNSTPKCFFAMLYSYNQLQNEMLSNKKQADVYVGQNAISALSELVQLL